MRESYTNLKLFIKYLEKILIHKNIDVNDEIRYLSGLIFLSIPKNTSSEIFETNRYFLESVGLKRIPVKDCTNEKYKESENLIIELKKSFLKDINHDEFWKNYPDRNYTINQEQLRHLKENGFVIVENCIDHRLCDDLINRINAERRIDIRDSKGYDYNSGMAYRIYHLINRDPLFQFLLTHPVITTAMDTLFHRDTLHDLWYLSSFHANILKPGAQASIWHIDCAVPEPIPDWPMRGNVNFILHDQNDNNGSTQIAPGSHKSQEIPKKYEMDQEKYIKITAKK